jgi:predicted small secreted protein
VLCNKPSTEKGVFKMKKTVFFITTFIIAALTLAACSGNKPATLGPGVQNTPAIQTEVPGAATTETSPAPATTQIAVTQIPTQPASTATPQVTTPGQLPSTGSSSQPTDIGRVSNLLQLPVMDQNNQTIGTVNDMVLNLKGLQAEYVIVGLSQASGATPKQVAVP